MPEGGNDYFFKIEDQKSEAKWSQNTNKNC
jgi:hypothetical protein